MESGDTDKYYHAWNTMFEEIGHKWLTRRLWFSLAVELRAAGLWAQVPQNARLSCCPHRVWSVSQKTDSLMEVISAFPHARDVFSYGPAAVAVSSSPRVVTHLPAKPTRAQAHMDVPSWRSWTICAVWMDCMIPVVTITIPKIKTREISLSRNRREHRSVAISCKNHSLFLFLSQCTFNSD